MAFTCSFSSITATTAIFEASFTGGQASYEWWRMVNLTIADPNVASDDNTTLIISTEKGGGSSYFTALIRNLKPDTEYGFYAEVGYGPSNTDDSKITWLGTLDDGSTAIKYSASGSFQTASDGTTAYFTMSGLSEDKYSLMFYATFTYDETILPYVTEMDKLTVVYTTDSSMASGLTTLRFDSTSHEATSDTEGIYEWNDIVISGLKPGVTYYWKGYCGSQSDEGSVTGYIVGDSTTLPPEPNALSVRILPISASKATVTGIYYDAETEALSDFNILHYRFSDDDGVTWGEWATCSGSVNTDNHMIIFEATYDGLDSGETYTYQAYVGSTNPWG